MTIKFDRKIDLSRTNFTEQLNFHQPLGLVKYREKDFN